MSCKAVYDCNWTIRSLVLDIGEELGKEDGVSVFDVVNLHSDHDDPHERNEEEDGEPEASLPGCQLSHAGIRHARTCCWVHFKRS